MLITAVTMLKFVGQALFSSPQSPPFTAQDKKEASVTLFLTQAVAIRVVLFFYHAARDNKSWDMWSVDHCSITVDGGNISASSHANL